MEFWLNASKVGVSRNRGYDMHGDRWEERHGAVVAVERIERGIEACDQCGMCNMVERQFKSVWQCVI